MCSLVICLELEHAHCAVLAGSRTITHYILAQIMFQMLQSKVLLCMLNTYFSYEQCFFLDDGLESALPLVIVQTTTKVKQGNFFK